MNSLEVCKHCDFAECINVILNHPELVVKCIHFGNLRKYIDSLEMPSECGMLSPSVIDKFNSYGCTSFILTPDEIQQLKLIDENDCIENFRQNIFEASGCPLIKEEFSDD